MRQFISTMLVATLVFQLCGSAKADEGRDAKAVIDKAIQAVGGEKKLGSVQALTWKTKGKMTFNGNENTYTSESTAKGIDHFRQEFEGEFGGNQVKGVTVLAGDKGWRKFGDEAREIENEALANQKRMIYLQIAAATILPLKGEGFKTERTGEEKVGDKPAVAVKVTGPDGKDFQLFFDKESGLLVKQVAKVAGFRGEEFTQETTFSNYLDFDGIKRATKIETKRNGEKFFEQELADFKAIDKVDPMTFAKPE